MSQQWKNHERNVAKALQGTRIPRGADFSASLPDVIADSSLTIPQTNGLIFAECKYSVSNPWVRFIADQYENKLIYVVDTKEDKKYAFCALQDIRLFKSKPYGTSIVIEKNVPSYIKGNLEQCVNYTIFDNPITTLMLVAKTGLTLTNKPILPIVVIAEKGNRTRICYTEVKYIDNFYKV